MSFNFMASVTTHSDFYIRAMKSFPGGSVLKNSPADARDTRDTGQIPGSGRFPGVGNDTPFQYSWLENFMDWGAWWATVHVVAKSWTQLSDWEHNEKSLKDVKYGRSWEGVEAWKTAFLKRSILQQKCRESIGRDLPRNQVNLEATVIVGHCNSYDNSWYRLGQEWWNRDVEKQMNLGQTK